MFFGKAIILLIFMSTVITAQFYENQRCRCVCPSQTSLFNTSSEDIADRKLYIALVPSDQCTCDIVILPRVSDETRRHAQVFCPKCECRYESRNTTIIMIVVIVVLWTLMLLCAYSIFLTLLQPLVGKRKLAIIYRNMDEAHRPLMDDDFED
ncbi:unnamed protein product [Leptosia nina]|uniref:Transmembrane protein 9 n=1 Tax=Leptosia nina TaxID=320188 RepID=A0AAV1K2V0_9NEOP